MFWQDLDRIEGFSREVSDLRVSVTYIFTFKNGFAQKAATIETTNQ